MPFGVVGLVHATMVSLYYNRGEFEAAEQASKTAGKWVKIAFIIGLIVIILYVVLRFFCCCLFLRYFSDGFYKLIPVPFPSGLRDSRKVML